ncbi:MAG TPA: DUF4203 domain-containing protein [Acidimicrobiia bacterium]|nr:DUF4203 domain-containing protein [Acidimicrobiia bacterium]
MGDIALGIFAILAGLLFCFRGYLAMRFVIPIWGAFSGFILGAGLVASLSAEGFLVSVLGWVVGAVLALVFGLFAYLYYEVAVLLAMSAIGFALGTSVMVALGVTWSWLIILVGLAVGIVLAAVAIVGDLPMTLLAVLTAFGGASVAVAGTMLLFGVISIDDFDSAATTQRLDDDWWWYAMFVVLAVAGIIAQIRSTVRLRASLREAWAESGGWQFRTT